MEESSQHINIDMNRFIGSYKNMSSHESSITVTKAATTGLNSVTRFSESINWSSIRRITDGFHGHGCGNASFPIYQHC